MEYTIVFIYPIVLSIQLKQLFEHEQMQGRNWL